MQLSLPLALLATSSLPLAAAAPVQVGKWLDEIKLLPDGKLPHVPLLGNGYLGIAMNTDDKNSDAMGPGRPGAVDLWLNTNAMWDCQESGQTAPPALCSRKALGGISIRPRLNATAFVAEQRVGTAQLWSERRSEAGSAFQTLTYLHPTMNVLVTELRWLPSVSEPSSINVELATWALDGFPVTSNVTADSVSVSRQMTQSESYRSMWTALATKVRAPHAAAIHSRQQQGGGATGVTTVHSLEAGNVIQVVTAAADNLLTGSGADPTEAALELAKAEPKEVSGAAATWWRDFWSHSSIHLPTQPQIQEFWYGAQFITAGMTATSELLERTRGELPASGLYGPWVTTDNPSWNGDYTLDYNQEAQYYGVYSSNHPELAAAYFPPITEWMASARNHAKAEAEKAGVTCASSTLHFACHLAPWGYQSRDTNTYMNWNGMFAALPFINDFEYMQNLSFARDTVYPLLDGLNEWSHCYLQKSGSGSDYILEDWRKKAPDQEHEGQNVRNPQIGLSLMMRMAQAQLNIAKAINVTAPAHVQEIVAHLAPFNRAPFASPSPPPPEASNVTKALRCHDDYHMGGESSLDACEAACFNDGDCWYFTFCGADSRVDAGHCPKAATCWRYRRGASCDSAEGFTSGSRVASPPATKDYVWTAFTHATVKQSDNFALYPLWPSEVINGIDVDAETQRTALITSKVYSNFPNGRPVSLFPAAVRAGAGADGAYAWSPSEIVSGLNAYLDNYQGPNFLPYAPGGGTENVGVSQAVNDMLVQAPAGRYIHLFPVWPEEDPASFTSLRVKGAFLVSASWNNVSRSVSDVVIEATVSSSCNLRNPWASSTATLLCGDRQEVMTAATTTLWFTWSMSEGEKCELKPQQDRPELLV